MGRPSIRERRRGEVARAFARVLGAHGRGGATIAAVATEAGIAPGLVHHYFESKEDLYEALLEQLVAEFRRRAAARAEEDPLEVYVDAALALDDRSDVSAARAWVGIFAEALSDPDLFAKVRRMLDAEVLHVERRGNGMALIHHGRERSRGIRRWRAGVRRLRAAQSCWLRGAQLAEDALGDSGVDSPQRARSVWGKQAEGNIRPRTLPTIQSERLVLRPFALTDLGTYHALMSDASIATLTKRSALASRPESETRLRHLLREQDEGGVMTWAITLRGSELASGFFGLWRFVTRHRRAVVSFDLLPDHWKECFASEALARVVGHAFEDPRPASS